MIENRANITLCWIPTHCGTMGNERADALANEGTKAQQGNTPVTFNIIRSKIRNEKWKIEHERAARTFQDRRRPKTDIEAEWPMELRRKYSRFRSGHALELKHHRHFINMEEDSDCECGEGKETIEHVLCHCPMLEEKRRREYHGEVKLKLLVEEPEICRRILKGRYEKLRTEEERKPAEVNNDVTQPRTRGC